MKFYCLLFIAVLTAVGCAENEKADRFRTLQSGREMRLAYHFEMHSAGFSVSEEMIDDKVTKHDETPFDSTELNGVEMPLLIAAIPGSDNLKVTMTVRSFHSGNAYCANGEQKHEESTGFQADSPINPASEIEMQLRDAQFIATIDRSGRIVSSDIAGKYWNSRKQELAQAVKKGTSQAQADLALRWSTPGIFAAMEDALAYLPPEGMQPGQTWKVKRDYVLPYHAYGFYMMTNGCSYAKETTTCTLKSVEARGTDQIAVISISGQRVPHDPEPSMPKRVNYFSLTGKLEVNLRTRAVESLQLEDVPIWMHPKEETFTVKFSEKITLKPK